ncbi:MAG: hypothetical protein JWR80_4807 [Bradyrhizobium sp.]|nr:hypothetical protein [Bradyrhizobium sp.]
MGILAEILPFKASGAATADVDGALSRLASGRQLAMASIALITARRRSAILADASDQIIVELDAAADHHRLALERIDVAEEELLARLNRIPEAASIATALGADSTGDDRSISPHSITSLGLARRSAGRSSAPGDPP